MRPISVSQKEWLAASARLLMAKSYNHSSILEINNGYTEHGVVYIAVKGQTPLML